ncbi:energy transducer TonB [Lacinutrix neustonica]|uniref:energy transducer TonB n=1 Tax=Lacinutrix neustonica TaxID=2980107 RepID=UPI0028BD54C1|nr:hypothetical protein [Lacinutrix neustonica]
MKYWKFVTLLCFPFFGFAQESNINEQPPVFESCKEQPFEAIQKCFDIKVFDLLFKNFIVPERLVEEGYRGEVIVLFEVEKEGTFRVLYVDAITAELKAEAIRVFQTFPQIAPATYNGIPTYKQYSIKLKIPLGRSNCFD